MNHPYGCTVNAAGKKEIRSSAALSLVVGLILALSGAAAWATVKPISGIPVGLEGDPGSIKLSTKTDENGAFQFAELPAGKYKLTLPGQPAKSITVGAKGSITGVLSEGPGGKASLTFNGQTGSADIPTAPVNTSRSNKKAGRVAEKEPPLPTSRAVSVASGDVNGDGIDAGTGPVAKPTSPGATVPGGGSLGTPAASSPKGDGQLPGLATPGTPIQGIPIGLEGDPEGIRVSTTTDANGAFQFSKLPAGKYKLIFPDGQPARSVTVGANETTFSGAVKRGNDGGMSIFDRWGKLVPTHVAAPALESGDRKPTKKATKKGPEWTAPQTIDGAVGLPLNPTATPSKRSKASNTATKGDGGNH